MRWKEVVTETVSGLNDIPDLTGMDYGDSMPVAEYQKRTRLADQPLRVWVYKSGKRWVIVQNDDEFEFKDLVKVGKWLDANGYRDSMGVTRVNV